MVIARNPIEVKTQAVSGVSGPDGSPTLITHRQALGYSSSPGQPDVLAGVKIKTHNFHFGAKTRTLPLNSLIKIIVDFLRPTVVWLVRYHTSLEQIPVGGEARDIGRQQFRFVGSWHSYPIYLPAL